jgi:hypothetical protein
LEAIHRDYSPRGVRFYYVYKSLAHPEKNGYVQPFTIEERLNHIQEAKQRLGVKIPWLCDTMGNDLVHALGSAPNSEFIVDPDGNVVRKRAWSNPVALRRDLEELMGAVENPTKPKDLGLKFDLQTASAESKVIERIKVPRGLLPIVVEPLFDARKTPFYVKLRADADADLLKEGTGKLYLGFHIDPLYDFHWNNLTKPIHLRIDAAESTVVPESLDGPKVEVQADVDPREFLVDVESWDGGQPLRLTVEYFACNDEKGICVAVKQEYRVHAQFDPDSGWPALRNYPRPLNETK